MASRRRTPSGDPFSRTPNRYRFTDSGRLTGRVYLSNRTVVRRSGDRIALGRVSRDRPKRLSPARPRKVSFVARGRTVSPTPLFLRRMSVSYRRAVRKARKAILPLLDRQNGQVTPTFGMNPESRGLHTIRGIHVAYICAKRKVRREVLFARRETGKGGAAKERRKHDLDSTVKC